MKALFLTPALVFSSFYLGQLSATDGVELHTKIAFIISIGAMSLWLITEEE